MENTEWFVRFKVNLKLANNKTSLHLVKDNESEETRYAIMREDKDNYYINHKPNALKPGQFIRLDKTKEGKVFDVYLEAV